MTIVWLVDCVCRWIIYWAGRGAFFPRGGIFSKGGIGWMVCRDMGRMCV